MKYIIVIVLIVIILLLIILWPKRKKNNSSNKTSSNIILSAANSTTSCYDTEFCDNLCKGYRCSENCVRSSTQCQEGETGCYGSEQDCTDSCTPVYRCNSASGVVKEYNSCVSGEQCYTGTLDNANANCVKTYSCIGSGPTGATGCNTSSSFGPPCATSATNCYNSSTSCINTCIGYRCSNCAMSGAKCDGTEPNCYNTSAACSTGAGSCPSVYRCSDNCTASRTACTDTELRQGQCHTSVTDCKKFCTSTYRCTPDKKCVQDYIPCSTSETCFTGQPACFAATGASCKKGYRCATKCAESTMCYSGESGCHDTLQLCINSCTGYRCNVNCETGKGCTPSETPCYLTASECKTTCPAYRCGVANNVYGCYASSSKCTESEVGSSCFTVDNCLNICSQYTVFTRIANNTANMKYKIVNLSNNRALSGGTNKNNWVNIIYDPDNDNFNPDQFWTFKNADYADYKNFGLSAFIINYQNKQLVCRSDGGNNTNNDIGLCGSIDYSGDSTDIYWHRTIILPSSDATERLNGICYLISAHYVTSDQGGGFMSLDNNNYLKIVSTKNDTSKWKIIPYENGIRK